MGTHAEVLVLRIGHAYQQVTDWHEWRPPADTTAKAMLWWSTNLD
ncbi:MAG: hypothetical protein O3B84_01570 [Chloroflexi bacterium]|nr:hypothetical protein [Chloroflexota bacterium]